MTKINVLDIEGKKIKEIAMPSFFQQKVRRDIIAKVLEVKKTKQPYAPSFMAGRQHSASGKIVHKRHAWKSQYGRGISRIPRKIMTRRGGQFNWIGAEVPNTRGGRRAHPPKVIAMINTKKINKKEQRLAFISALSATADSTEVIKKYPRISKEQIKNLPLVVEGKITSIKTGELKKALQKITGELINISIKKRKIRPGKGKSRGRKYKTNAGMLLVTGSKEKIKTSLIDVQSAKQLSVTDLAKGGQGRITMYTEEAIKEIEKRLGGKEEGK